MVTSPAYEGCWLLRPGRAGRQHCPSSRILYSLSVTYFLLFKNGITDSPGNSRKLISLDSQSESPASCMDSADPNTTLFSSLLLKKREKKKNQTPTVNMQTWKPSKARKENKVEEIMRNSVLQVASITRGWHSACELCSPTLHLQKPWLSPTTLRVAWAALANAIY